MARNLDDDGDGRDVLRLVLIAALLAGTIFLLGGVLTTHARDQLTLTDNSTQLLLSVDEGNWTDVYWDQQWTASANWQHFGTAAPNSSGFMSLYGGQFDLFMALHPTVTGDNASDLVEPQCVGYCQSCSSDDDCCQVSALFFCAHVAPNPCGGGTELCAQYQNVGESCDGAGFICLTNLTCNGGVCRPRRRPPQRPLWRPLPRQPWRQPPHRPPLQLPRQLRPQP